MDPQKTAAQPGAAAAQPGAAVDDAMSLLDTIIAEHQDDARRYLPIMNPKLAEARKVALIQLKTLVLVEGEDYGKPPGTDKDDARDVLLKPGAEKICAYFGYVPLYSVLEGSIEDWNGADHKGEPLFYYHISCVLKKNDVAVGAGSGSCNSWESKYRYRFANRECPSCHRTDTLIKGKAEYERDPEFKRRGSWLCYEKKGGCGGKWFGDDPVIMGQVVASVPNDKIYDLVNTVRKMADKRAYIAAVLSATGASQFFTQDLDDMPDMTDVTQGTRADQKAIQEKKIAAGKDAEAKRTATKGKAPSPEPQTVDVGAQPGDPKELHDTLSAYTRGDKPHRASLAQQLLDMLTSRNAQGDGEAVLAKHNCKSPADLPDLSAQQACVRDLWLAVAAVW